MCQLCCFKVWSRVCTEIIEISQDGLVETPSLFVCSFRKLKFFKAQLFVFISGQCLATVWQAAVALVSFPSRLMLWKTLAYQKYQKYHWSALWCCPHPGGNSARTASCENVDFARGGRQIKVSRAFISWFMRWHKLHHCYAPSLLRTVVTRTWSYLYFRGCKFGLLITFADYERGMGWEHWMHFSSRLPMQSVFFFAQGQLASLKQSSPGLREQLRDRLQSVMQADRIPLSTHVPSSLLPLQQDVAEFLKSQVILPFCLSKETVTRQQSIPRR